MPAVPRDNVDHAVDSYYVIPDETGTIGINVGHGRAFNESAHRRHPIPQGRRTYSDIVTDHLFRVGRVNLAERYAKDYIDAITLNYLEEIDALPIDHGYGPAVHAILERRRDLLAGWP